LDAKRGYASCFGEVDEATRAHPHGGLVPGGDDRSARARREHLGFYANHHPGRIDFNNNTAYNNPANYNMLADSGYPSSHVIRNNVAFGSGGTISNLSGGTATFNSWNLQVTVSTADFLGVDLAEALGPRNADGSLPYLKFMHLVAGSDLIDAGTDVGLPFVGSTASPSAGGAAGSTTGAGCGCSLGSRRDGRPGSVLVLLFLAAPLRSPRRR
jgi:hypothetical protein